MLKPVGIKKAHPGVAEMHGPLSNPTSGPDRRNFFLPFFFSHSIHSVLFTVRDADPHPTCITASHLFAQAMHGELFCKVLTR